MGNQKSLSHPLEVVTVFQDGGPIVRLIGWFKVHYDGHWVIVQKLNESRNKIISTLIYNSPTSVIWREKDGTDEVAHHPV